MTLNVSLLIPDGIVLASDSLATQMQQVGSQKMNVQTTCSCGKTETKEIQVPPQVVPASTWPYAQKLFPICGVFGLATFGNAFVNNRSIFSHMDELNRRFPEDDKKEDFFPKISKFIVGYFENQLKAEMKKSGIDENLMPDTFLPFGFQLCGYRKTPDGESVASVNRIFIGKKSVVQEFSITDIGSSKGIGFGCIPSGDDSVVQILWQKNSNIANYTAFSLQDAVDYAKFLIRTTADFQRFLGKFPTVGGDIDVALITNQVGFRWIAQKPLYRMLEREEKIV